MGNQCGLSLSCSMRGGRERRNWAGGLVGIVGQDRWALAGVSPVSGVTLRDSPPPSHRVGGGQEGRQDVSYLLDRPPSAGGWLRSPGCREVRIVNRPGPESPRRGLAETAKAHSSQTQR